MAGTPNEDLLFVGTHGWVAALNKFTGAEVWRTNLPRTGWSVVTLLYEDGVLFAATGGRVFALNPQNGDLAWSNAMPGLGSSHLCLATARQSAASAAPLPQIAEAEEQASRHSSAPT